MICRQWVVGDPILGDGALTLAAFTTKLKRYSFLLVLFAHSHTQIDQREHDKNEGLNQGHKKV